MIWWLLACQPGVVDAESSLADALAPQEAVVEGSSSVSGGPVLLPPGLLWLTSTAWIEGQTATLSVSGADPGEEVVFVFGTQGTGAGPCPGALGGECLDLVSPRLLARVTADVDGNAEHSLTVPSGHLGAGIDLQAAHGGTDPEASNVVAMQLCLVDADADGVCDDTAAGSTGDTGTTGGESTGDTGTVDDTGLTGLTGLTGDTGSTVDTSLDLPPVATQLNACGVDPVLDLGFTPEFTLTEYPVERLIETNGIPTHLVGDFPGSGTPHSIAETSFSRRVPVVPSGTGEDLDGNTFGVALNGVIFAPFANEYYDNDPASGWQYEPLGAGVLLGLDCNYAHVFPAGNYHYHGMPEGLMDQQGDGPDMYWVGYAADGYPIYARWGYDDPDDPSSPLRPMQSGYELIEGDRATEPFGPHDGTFVEDYAFTGVGDLDECNGRFGSTPEFGETYHYYVTDSFPYVPRCWNAAPHATWTPGP